MSESDKLEKTFSLAKTFVREGLDRKIREAFERAMSEPARPLYWDSVRDTYTSTTPVMTLVLEWRGWMRTEKFSELTGLGREFLKSLPNGRKGKFTFAEEFIAADGTQGYLYRCEEEL